MLPKRDILNVGLSLSESEDELAAAIIDSIAAGTRCNCVALNPEKLLAARHDQELRELLNSATFTICDGVGLLFASKMYEGARVARITGVDLFYRLLQEAGHQGWPVFLLGASKEVNASAADRLRDHIPGLIVAGRHDGFFSDDRTMVQMINQSGAKMLFVALGSPKQEYWIASNWDRLEAPFRMGIGGSLDVASGRISRAPVVFRKLGLEFLYRLMREPWRLRRQLALPGFLVWAAVERVRPRRGNGNATQDSRADK
jgi:N-acetylglucosaminyldiphosphoundecaprenol N-acetyl-beta-D-mannosaminyltransferase